MKGHNNPIYYCKVSISLKLFSLIIKSAKQSLCIKLYNIESSDKIIIYNSPEMWKKMIRGHTELNHGPLDLQSNALPLSYTPSYIYEGLKMSLQIDGNKSIIKHRLLKSFICSFKRISGGTRS